MPTGGKDCNCATCIACTCLKHRCDAKAARRAHGHREPLHYTRDELTSVTAASYRPPTADELREASCVAARPDWGAINKLHPHQKFEGQSTTAATFRGEQNPRPAGSQSNGRPFFDRSPQDDGRSTLPFEGKSAYAEQYAAPDATDRQRAVPSDRHLQSQFALHTPGAKLQSDTSNSRDYRAYPPQRQEALPSPPSQPRPHLKFEGESQTHADFQRKSRDPSQPLGHRMPDSQQYVPNHLRFEGQSVTADTYRGQQLPPSRPQTAYAPPPRQSLPFTGESQSHADYRKPPRQDYAQQRTGVDVTRSHFANPAELYGGSGPGTYNTEAMDQYTGKSVPPCPAAAWASLGNTPASTPGTRTPRTY